jgi:hypothetical protein
MNRFFRLAVLGIALTLVAAHFEPALAAVLPSFFTDPGAAGVVFFGMTTLAANTPRVYEAGEFGHVPMRDNVKIYEGSAVGDDGAGGARALVAADPFRGFAVENADNTVSGHATGAIAVQVRLFGVIQLAVSSAVVGDLGKAVYASDDNAFTYTASGNSYVGRVMRCVDSTHVAVAFDARRGGFGKNAVTAINYGTAGNNLSTAIATYNGTAAQQDVINQTLVAAINDLIQKTNI